MNSIQRQARVAGVLYLGLLIAPIGLLYVPGKLIVSGNAAATAENLRNAESLLCLGIATLVLALYRLFKPVSETLARQVVVLGALVSVAAIHRRPRPRGAAGVHFVTARHGPTPVNARDGSEARIQEVLE